MSSTTKSLTTRMRAAERTSISADAHAGGGRRSVGGTDSIAGLASGLGRPTIGTDVAREATGRLAGRGRGVIGDADVVAADAGASGLQAARARTGRGRGAVGHANGITTALGARRGEPAGRFAGRGCRS